VEDGSQKQTIGECVVVNSATSSQFNRKTKIDTSGSSGGRVEIIQGRCISIGFDNNQIIGTVISNTSTSTTLSLTTFNYGTLYIYGIAQK